jgi:hypothetical protein
MAATRESIITTAKNFGWKRKDVIILCNHLGLPEAAKRNQGHLELLADALSGPPTQVLDRLTVPFSPGERVVFVGEFPEWPHGRILIVELSWPQRTWVLNPQTGKQDNACNLRTEDLKRYDPEGQE